MLRINFILFFVSIVVTLLLSTACLKEEIKEVYDPPTVSTNTVNNITHNSAQTGGVIIDDGGDKITQKGIVWSMTKNPTLNNAEGVINKGEGTAGFTVVIEDLNPITSYFVRAFAVNRGGTIYGEERHFMTKSGVNDQNFGQPCETPTVTDIEGNVYNTIKIGDQCWMVENLRTKTYADGTEIYHSESEEEADSLEHGAFMIFDHKLLYLENINSDEEMIEKYGLLYNWYTIENAGGICPEGWKVPSNQDWEELTSKVKEINPNNVANQLKSCRQVNSPLGGNCYTSQHPRWANHDVHFGNDFYGFSAIPGGGINPDTTINLARVGFGGYWWTSTEHLYSPFRAVARNIQYMNGNVNTMGDAIKRNLFSIRCIKE